RRKTGAHSPAPHHIEARGGYPIAAGHASLPQASQFRAEPTPLWFTRLCFGMEKGPRWRGDRRPKGTPLMTGFTMALGTIGSLDRDAGGGDGSEDLAGVFCSGQGDQGDLPRAGCVAEGGSEGSALGGDRVPLRA